MTGLNILLLVLASTLLVAESKPSMDDQDDQVLDDVVREVSEKHNVPKEAVYDGLTIGLGTKDASKILNTIGSDEIPEAVAKDPNFFGHLWNAVKSVGHGIGSAVGGVVKGVGHVVGGVVKGTGAVIHGIFGGGRLRGNADCWNACGHKSGNCKACGHGYACCRRGWHDSWSCAGAHIPCHGHHCCSRKHHYGDATEPKHGDAADPKQGGKHGHHKGGKHGHGKHGHKGGKHGDEKQ